MSIRDEMLESLGVVPEDKFPTVENNGWHLGRGGKFHFFRLQVEGRLVSACRKFSYVAGTPLMAGFYKKYCCAVCAKFFEAELAKRSTTEGAENTEGER